MSEQHLASLKTDFRIRARELVRLCKAEGAEMLPYCGYRSPEVQARLWRQSRTPEQIEEKANSYRDQGLPELADILLHVGAQAGRHVTNAGPGESWHQYGQALDCVPIVDGVVRWDEDTWQWDVYGAITDFLGLRWLGNYPGLVDKPHVQLPKGPSPLSYFDGPDQVREALAL